MTGAFQAHGLTGGWLNGWLAAVGATVIEPALRLSWTDDPVPSAVLHLDTNGTVGSVLADRLPDLDALGQLAIARHHPAATREMGRTVGIEAFAERAKLVRSGLLAKGDRSLEASLTDLADLSKADEVSHAPLDPPAPKGTTLFDRLVNCREKLIGLQGPSTDVAQLIELSFLGRGRRVQANGLGFDYRRAASGVHANAKVHVDPVIECMAFFGLVLLPVRGDGRNVRQRGFVAAPSRRWSLRWPCWAAPLDEWAIDALLDRFHAALPRALGDDLSPRQLPERTAATLDGLGITAIFASLAQRPRGSADTYRAYASERVR